MACVLHDCDVIVVNYNAGTLLVHCVQSILDSGANKAIVVDNASSDGSVDQLLQSIGDSERLVVKRNDRNLGFAAGCNIGVHLSSAENLLFLNPDGVLERHSLARMLEVLSSSTAIGMVGGFLCNPDGSEQPGGRRVFPTPKRAFLRAFGLSRLAKHFPETFNDFLLHKEPLPAGPIPVEAISGACMLVNRNALSKVGLWDEGYFLHCEDLDWCMRFRQHGLKVMFVPDARITHIWGACGRQRPFFVEWHKHRGMLRFYKKFFHNQYHGALWGLVVLGVWLRFAMVSSYYAGRLTLAKAVRTRG